MYTINKSDISLVNIDHLLPQVLNLRDYFLLPPGQSFYRTLAYFSTLFNDSLIVELGTRAGSSAIALSYNQTNRVITYDITDYIKGKITLPNIEFRIENILTDENKMAVLLDAQLLFIDIDPHSGCEEDIIHQFLVRHNYGGIALFDDIGLPTKYPELAAWWDNLDAKKYDLRDVGFRKRGFGLIDYGNNIERIV
jgi:predicted O-methyltransferase YrrM